MLEKLKENKDEINEVSAEVCSGVETNTVVHHLASRGIVNLGEAYDIPNALSVILEKVKSVADPQTPFFDDRNALEFFGFIKERTECGKVYKRKYGKWSQHML